MKTAEEYRETIIGVLRLKAKLGFEDEIDPEDLSEWHEGYLDGLWEAIRVIEDSKFLTE